ncbi:hypothetical protein [Nostoc sp.]
MKNSTHSWVGVFGHGEWGTCTERCRSMGHREELPISNAQATGRLSLSTHKGMKFPAAFDKSPDCLKMSVQSFITE